ncbi:MAG: hypothetical protein DRJ37_06785 [Thermoprotei archaeon]|nr:MAG: hypothetical protein DRJ37_06785 [Thermoprotei archaeon]
MRRIIALLIIALALLAVSEERLLEKAVQWASNYAYNFSAMLTEDLKALLLNNSLLGTFDPEAYIRHVGDYMSSLLTIIIGLIVMLIVVALLIAFIEEL